MNKRNRKLVSLFLSIIYLTGSECFANKERNVYSPYIQFNGMKLFNAKEYSASVGVDTFLPLWQQNRSDLVFINARLGDRSGSPFEVNLHFGYRRLLNSSQKIYGIYGGFDRKQTGLNNYFNQVTLGIEHWNKNWFIGSNVYCPIGNSTKNISNTTAELRKNQYDIYNVWLVAPRKEKALAGLDTEIGYEFIEGLVGYIGGYYFNAKEVNAIYGPRARITYDWSLNNGNRILGVFDKIGIEANVQRDTPRGTTCYLSINTKIGLTSGKINTLNDISRHMVDPVRRDRDIVSGITNKQESVFKNSKNEIIDIIDRNNNIYARTTTTSENDLSQLRNLGFNVLTAIEPKVDKLEVDKIAYLVNKEDEVIIQDLDDKQIIMPIQGQENIQIPVLRQTQEANNANASTNPIIDHKANEQPELVAAQIQEVEPELIIVETKTEERQAPQEQSPKTANKYSKLLQKKENIFINKIKEISAELDKQRAEDEEITYIENYYNKQPKPVDQDKLIKFKARAEMDAACANIKSLESIIADLATLGTLIVKTTTNNTNDLDNKVEVIAENNQETAKHSDPTYDKQDPYKILGVSPTATMKEVRQEYWKLMKSVHPDKNGLGIDNSNNAKAVTYNGAYDAIKQSFDNIKTPVITSKAKQFGDNDKINNFLLDKRSSLVVKTAQATNKASDVITPQSVIANWLLTKQNPILNNLQAVAEVAQAEPSYAIANLNDQPVLESNQIITIEQQDPLEQSLVVKNSQVKKTRDIENSDSNTVNTPFGYLDGFISEDSLSETQKIKPRDMDAELRELASKERERQRAVLSAYKEKYLSSVEPINTNEISKYKTIRDQSHDAKDLITKILEDYVTPSKNLKTRMLETYATSSPHYKRYTGLVKEVIGLSQEKSTVAVANNDMFMLLINRMPELNAKDPIVNKLRFLLDEKADGLLL